jgi:hypothetical protein
MLAGYRAATGDILIVMDADGSNDPRELPRFITALMQGADMVKGSRFAPGGGTTDMPRLRKLGNGGFVVTSNILFGTKFTDLCYGNHAFWRHCLDDLELDSSPGFEIDTALYLQAVRNNLHIVEVPSFEGDRFYGYGKLETFTDGLRILRTIGEEWLSSFKKNGSKTEIGFRGPKPIPNGKNKLVSKPLTRSQALANSYMRQLSGTFVDTDQLREKTLRKILMLAMNEIDAQSGSIFLLDEAGSVGMGFLFHGDTFHVRETESDVEVVQDGLAGWVINNRQPAIVRDTLDDPRWVRTEWESDNQEFSRSAISIPLIFNNQVSAVLTLVRKSELEFTDADLFTLNDVIGVS